MIDQVLYILLPFMVLKEPTLDLRRFPLSARSRLCQARASLIIFE
jgi:hypothetical protein